MGVSTATALAIGSMAVAAAGTMASISMANAQAKRAGEIANQNAQLAYKELGRQQEEANRIAVEQKSDRIRKADHELGALRANDYVAGGNQNRFMALLNEIGYVEGLDLSRIETNRKNTIDAIQSKKDAAQLGAIEQVDAAAMMAKSATTSGVLNLVGTGLQIGASHYARQEDLAMRQDHYRRMEEIQTNKVK